MNDPGMLSAFIEALGWTLVHFLWQGVVIGLVYAAALFTLRQASANARYWVGMLTLAAMLAAPLLTVFAQFDAAASALANTPVAVVTGAATVAATTPDLLASLEQRVESLLPWAVLAWFTGVMLLSGRLAVDFVRIRRLAMVDVTPLSPRMQRAVERLIESLQIRSAVRVFESARVAVPMVVGWLRPVVLLPPSALMGLTPRQLELIISHELAHVKRLDYLFNLLQIVVETLLFYHPAVRMVSIRVRMERENCCDDIVVARTGDTLAYARALTEVEGLRCSSGMQLSLAATGGHLRGRVTRLVAAPAPQRGAVHWMAGLVLLASGFGAVTGARVALDEAPPPEPVAPAAQAAQQAVFDAAQDRYAAPPLSAPVVPAPITATVSAATPVKAEAAVRESSPSPAVAARPAVERPAGEAATSLPPAPADQPLPESREVPAAAHSPNLTVAMAQAPVATPAPPPVASPAPDPARDLATGNVADRVSDLSQEDAAAAPQVPTPGEPVAEEPRSTTPVAPIRQSSPEPAPAPEVTGGALIKSPSPAYPRRARLKGQHGFVTARYTVTVKGRVEDVEIAESTSALFERSVKRTLPRWRYEPFSVDGEAQAVRLERTFEFELEGQSLAERRNNARCEKVTGSRLCRSRTGYDDLGVVVVYNDP